MVKIDLAGTTRIKKGGGSKKRQGIAVLRQSQPARIVKKILLRTKNAHLLHEKQAAKA
ncbi:TPA: hypothetical protein QHS04_001828 [Morganella morganii subsp. morganii]|nr:hypothetical protein [Morganella morganii subsp. morganii]